MTGKEITANSDFRAPVRPERAAEHIAKLFIGLLSASGGRLTDALAAEYLIAVEGLPEWAIDMAVDQFRRGLLGDGKFAPLPAGLAQAAREIANREFAENARASDRRAAIRENREREAMLAARTPEQKARVAAAHAKFKESLADAVDHSVKAERQALMDDINAKTHARFPSILTSQKAPEPPPPPAAETENPADFNQM